MPCKPTVDEYEKNHHKVLVLCKDAGALSMQIKSTLQSQIKGTSPASSSVQIAWAYHLHSFAVEDAKRGVQGKMPFSAESCSRHSRRCNSIFPFLWLRRRYFSPCSQCTLQHVHKGAHGPPDNVLYKRQVGGTPAELNTGKSC